MANFNMSSSTEARETLVQNASALPQCVQQWLRNSGASANPHVSVVDLEQTGLMRTSPVGKWMHVTANQHFNISRPAFEWKARVQMNPLVWFSGRDLYKNGKGSMCIKLFSLVPIVNARCYKIDQSSLLRFLGEMVWFPSAALSKYIYWKETSVNSAKAIINYCGVEAAGVFQFDEAGRVSSFTANRYMSKGTQSSLEQWYIPMTEWKLLNGVLIPTKGEVIWRLKEGDFSYFKWKINQICYQ